MLAAAEIAALRIEPVAQDWEIVQHPVEVLRDRRAVGLHVGAQIEVVAHGHAAEDASPFGHQVDAHCRGAVGRPAGDVSPLVLNAPVGRLDQARDGAQQRRLARAVGAENHDDLALFEMQFDAPMDTRAAVGGVQIVNL